MDTLKDVLLVFTVVLLVYVLYQRLLQVLGKKEKSKRYARVSEKLEVGSGWLNMELELEQPMLLELSVHEAQGEKLLTPKDQSLEIGSHRIQVDISTLKRGRYYIQLKTPSEVYSRYFELT
jgi:hypothetical protein